MNDVVEAIRQETQPNTSANNTYYVPPPTIDIQKYMSLTWPEKYPEYVAETKGWNNSVNQGLTHGQAWNFLTYDPLEGKSKRHLLVERAFNGVCVLGSGQCKRLNDMKPKHSPTNPRAASRRHVISQPQCSPPPTFSPTSTQSVMSITSDHSTDFSSSLFPTPPPASDSGTSSFSPVNCRFLSTMDRSPIPQAVLDAECLNHSVSGLEDWDDMSWLGLQSPDGRTVSIWIGRT